MAKWWWFWRMSLIVVVALVFMTHEVPEHPGLGKKILAEKVRQLMDWTKKNRMIRMSDAVFYHFVLETPRNYSIIVMFTTFQKFRSCVICKHAAEEFQILANSWQHSSAFTNKVFFAMVDYDKSPEAFQALQLMSVPSFLHFSAKRNFTSDDIYHLEERGIIAEQMAKWVAERTEIRKVNRIRQPTEYHEHFKLRIFLAVIGRLVYLLKWNRKFIFNKNLWAVLALCFVIMMTSGQMWTRIKRAPYAQRNPHTGRIHYIHGVSYSQFVAEMHVISLFNMCIFLGMMLLDKAATSRVNIIERKMMGMTGTCLVVIFFSWLSSLFRVKECEYPFGVLMDSKES